MVTKFVYGGAAPGANTNTTTLFSTVVAFPGGSYFPMLGINKFSITLSYSAAGTLKAYQSDDRGTNWYQVSQESIAAPAATESLQRDFLVEGMKDWKLDWTNGGSAQSPWVVSMAGVDDRAVA
jgi:hypothetical protein